MIFEKLDKFMPFINLDVIKDDRWVQTIEKAEKLLQVNEMIINKLAQQTWNEQMFNNK